VHHPWRITTNRPFKEWTKVFPDALNAQVIAERLTERSETFVLDGKGYRSNKA
jgi:DNA replication protein DnaC